ncbi:MAG: hypothetical protein VR68_07745 [Peptococcaceae bacterium BRH_c4a]|nr:MAG: hypothetical protein VR68_16220 [Peptococcaceae bacterium BRH_c4a]KJS00191.1 MAG: hypothetical protein VR68_07745 [Peptococcaceae bacterium BRH_c4a]
MPGQDRLKRDIIDRGLCSSCGMCVGLCPYIKTAGDMVRVINPCGLAEGACYSVCPKVSLDLREMDLAVFGREREDQALGVVREIYFARAGENRAAKAQYGGVASALAAFALKEGMVTGMALAGGGVLCPRPVLARTVDEVNGCAGSKYTAVPSLAVLNRALREGMSGLGLVGRPCQIAAARKAQAGNLAGDQFSNPQAVGMALGLFCFWSLSPDFYRFAFRRVKGEEMVRMDIPLEGPVVETNSGNCRWQLEEIRPFIKKPCSLCFDSTSEWADLSVGSTEFDPSWNTLIVRSDKGRELVDLALRRGAIEIAQYPEERLPLLRRAALNKKMRVLGLPEFEDGKPGFPVVGRYREQIEAQWGGVNQ